MTRSLSPPTLAELSIALEERELSLSIHNASATSWVVWLFPPDDPEQMIVSADDDLPNAIRRALAEWDRIDEEDPS